MTTTIICREAGFDCEGRIEASDPDEAMAMAAAHVKSAHPGVELTPELVEQVTAVMRVDQ